MDSQPVLDEQLVLSRGSSSRVEDVESLNLWGLGMEDVSLVRRMAAVEVLSLSVNKISSLAPFASCPRLRELYLRRNSVADVAEVAYLSKLDLRILWLCDNPCQDHPLYRQLIIHLLPSLVKLDNTDVTPDERAASQGLVQTNPEAAAIIDRVRDVLQDPVNGGIVPAETPSASGPAPSALAAGPRSTPASRVAEVTPWGARPTTAALPDAARAAGSPPSAGASVSAVVEAAKQQDCQGPMLTAVLSLLPALDRRALGLVRETAEKLWQSQDGQAGVGR